MERRTAIITGASRGLGRAVALQLARECFDVALVARDAGALETVAKQVRSFGARAQVHVMDLAVWSNGQQVAESIARDFGRLDLLVNNAGDGKRYDIHGLDDAALQTAFGSKFIGTCSLTAACWPLLQHAGGHVINIIGALAHTPSAQSLMGSAVCGALAGFTKALAEQGRIDGVRVNAIHPGWIDTGRLTTQLQAIADRDGHDDLERARQSFLAEIRMTRIGQPEDVAATVSFLASPSSSLIHGASIDVDGGLTKGL